MFTNISTPLFPTRVFMRNRKRFLGNIKCAHRPSYTRSLLLIGSLPNSSHLSTWLDSIRLNLVSPEFSHLIFIPGQSLGTFHPSFSTDCMQLQTDSRLNVLWPFYHHPGEPTSLCKLNTQSGNHCDCAVISQLPVFVCHGNQCQKYHHQIWKLWESSSSAKLLLLIMPNRYNQPSLEDIQQHTVTASTKPMYDSPVTAQTFETLQSNQHDQTT